MKLKQYPLPPDSELKALSALGQDLRITQEIEPGIWVFDKKTFMHEHPEKAQKTILSESLTPTSALHTMIQSACEQEWVVLFTSQVHIKNAYFLLANVHELLPVGMIKRVHIIIEDGARVLLQETACLNSKGKSKIKSMDIYVGKDAYCRFLFSGQDHPYIDPPLYYTWRVFCDESAEFMMTLTLGAHALIVHEVFLVLGGASAQAQLYSAYANNHDSAIYVHTRQIHQAPYTTSSVLAKGGLTADAYADFRGTIFIDTQAAQSDARLNNTHLLSGNAQAMSVPSLEVSNPDVQCFHGSATGYLDAEQIHYAASRGISEVDARNMILQGYYSEITETILDEQTAHTVLRKLTGLLAS